MYLLLLDFFFNQIYDFCLVLSQGVTASSLTKPVNAAKYNLNIQKLFYSNLILAI